MTDDRLTRIRAGGAIGPADAEWLLGENERLRAALAIVTHDRDTLLEMTGHTIEQVARRIEKLRGGVHEPSGERCGAYHPLGQAQCELPKRHPGDHEAYSNTPASAVAWPVVKSPG